MSIYESSDGAAMKDHTEYQYLLKLNNEDIRKTKHGNYFCPYTNDME